MGNQNVAPMVIQICWFCWLGFRFRLLLIPLLRLGWSVPGNSFVLDIPPTLVLEIDG